jgi:hypothetical protein
MTGPSEEWFMSGFGSTAEWAKDETSFNNNPAFSAVDMQFGPKESEYLSGVRTITARMRPDLSYHPGEMKLTDIRYFSVGILRMRMGHDPVEEVKMLNEAHDRAGTGGEAIAYEVTSGMPAGTIIFFSPMKDMENIDKDGEAFNKAMGPEGWATFMKMIEASSSTYEERFFYVNPRMSIPSKDMMAAAPDFWKPKPMSAPKSEAGEVMPAAKKDVKK